MTTGALALQRVIVLKGGFPLPSGQVTFMASGTTNLQAPYTDSLLQVAAATTLVADSTGAIIPVYLDPTLSYKMQFKDTVAAGSAVLYTVDPADALTQSSTTFWTQSIKSANFSIANTDTGKIFLVDCTSGNITVTLPAASTWSTNFGARIVKSDTSANTIIINRAGSDTINNALTSLTISTSNAPYDISKGRTSTNTEIAFYNTVFLDGVTAGTVTANKAIVANASKVIDVLTITTLTATTATITNLTAALTDASGQIYNASDSTKKIRFDASAISTGTTRGFFAPNSNVSNFRLGVSYAAFATPGSTAVNLSSATTPTTGNMSAAYNTTYTAKISGGALEINGQACLSNNTGGSYVNIALFRDSTLLGTWFGGGGSTSPGYTIPFSIRTTAPDTSVHTYSIYFAGSVGTTYINQFNGGGAYGSTCQSTIMVQEWS